MSHDVYVCVLMACSCLAAGQARADTVYHTTREIASPDAVQAAAADERHVYAVNSSRIVKYDRATGRELATSTGAAIHLNSGTLRDGKIHCAHSNFPNKPDRSEIKVLDPATMTLSTLKDFGVTEGSLTWIAFQGDTVWCMFAYYTGFGDDNAKSYLAEYDRAWRVKARWCFPPEVVSRLGKGSVSGGIWHENTFLVTGHDAKEIYRLKIPKTGNVLAYVETIPAPFTGQGIAYDPLTGGLVGIDRGRRKLIFAECRSGRADNAPPPR
ncbi:MAG: endonuclease [Kiritimatiellae bacterium]|nr:endonuclease [Kiritimatiellia bacterium]